VTESAEAEADDNSAEAEAAMFIKAKCEAGALFAARLSDPQEDYAGQFAHYGSVRDDCIARADRLEDEFYRGFAIHQIINMCVAAGDLAIARSLLVSVRDGFLRERIFETAPALKDTAP
jgi:hypothetical protein